MTPAAGWSGLLAGTFSAIFVWALSQVGVITLPGQGTAFVAASTGFVVDVLVSVIVSLCTKPKPVSELVGFVYSETPRSHFKDPEEASLPLLKRPVTLAIIALVLVIVLNIAF